MHNMKYRVNGGQVSKRKTRKDENIEKNTEELKQNRITAHEFLRNLTSKASGDKEPMEPIEITAGDESAEESFDSGPTNDPIIDDSCIVCYTNRPNVLLLPCQHLKFCVECIDKMESTTAQLKCPYCMSITTNKFVAFI